MNDGRKVVISLVNGQKLETVINTHVLVDELLNFIADHIGLNDIDRKYFQLAFVDELQHFYWLPEKRRILDCEHPRRLSSSNSVLELQYSVKFYSESFFTLEQPITFEFYFCETKSRLIREQLELPHEEFCTIVAHLLQIHDGDYFSDARARAALCDLLIIPRRHLRVFDVSFDDYENTVIAKYRKLSGNSFGICLLNFLTIAEKSPIYGSHFYQARDKNDMLWTLAFNNRGIYQLKAFDFVRPKKVFYWHLLDNLYYKDRRFFIEHRGREKNGMFDDIQDPFNDPTLCHRSSGETMTIAIQVFICETASLCKTLWCTAVDLHQFYLEQRSKFTNQKPSNGFVSTANIKELSEKLNSLVGKSPAGSSLPSLSSQSSTSNSFPVMNAVDGSSISLPSLNGCHIHTPFAKKSEEEKQKERDLYKELIERKGMLEEKLLTKLDELREVCIKEAEITGEMPKEIYKTLIPGEDEPKVKRRVGTAFSLSEDVFKKPSDENDRLTMLETDVELHRKIVAAAERLAKDKSMNKSVRKKRQKDLVAATQKLKGLEHGLHQLRLSASKPDVSDRIYQLDNTKRLVGQNSCPSTDAYTAKSCPTTPRGSFRDLATRSDVEKSDDEGGCIRSAQNSVKSVSKDSKYGEYPSRMCLNAPSHSGIRNNQSSSDFAFHSFYGSNKLPPAPNKKSDPCSAGYENVGYKSSASYKSSYRQTNFPTLNDSGQLRHRVHRAASDYNLPEQRNVETSNHLKSDLNHVVPTSMVQSDILNPSLPCRHVPSTSQSLTISPNVYMSSQRLRREYYHDAQAKEITYSINRSRPRNTPGLTNCDINEFIKKQAVDMGTIYQNSVKHSNNQSAQSSAPQLLDNSFVTASLDRRLIGNRQNSQRRMDLRNFGLPTSNMDSPKTHSSRSGSQLLHKLPAKVAIRSTTVFPVGNGHGMANFEMSKPLETTDVQRYVREKNTSSSSFFSSSPSNVCSISPTSHKVRSPPPCYSVNLKNGANGIFTSVSSYSKISPTIDDNNRLEAVRDYFGDSPRKEKNATIV